MNQRASPLLLSAIFVAACQSVPNPQDQPALLAEVNDAARAALQQAVNSAVGTDVMLADSAFTERSILVIERRLRSTLGNPLGDGRVMATPIRLQLVIDGANCILVDTRNGSRHPLEGVSCVAE